MTVSGQYPWVEGYQPQPLSEDLYGLGAALAGQPDVQAAPTVTEMFTRSRLPRPLWHAPVVEPPPPKPTVPPEVATSLGARVRAARQRRYLTRQQVADTLGTSYPVVTRVENGRVHPDELEVFERWLDDADEEGGDGAATPPVRPA